ncbi:MAG: hypothetical protein LBH18_03835, partial [Spirochaetaceae bacterium]|nr:hypothetical protein [Spirochaetaceae bacterium]
MKGRNILLYQQKYGKGKDRRNKRDCDYFASPGNFDLKPGLLTSCFNAWNSLATLRRDIRRNEEFVFGDQWSDRVFDYKKREWKTERQRLNEQGVQPSQYNILRGILRSIDGVWASSKTLPTCIAQKDDNKNESEVLTATLHSHYRKHELRKLTRSQLQQLLIGGIAVTKNHFVSRDGESDVVNDYVDPFSFFIDNTMKDPRYADCTLVGCFYDMPVEDIAGNFCKGSAKRAQAIREIYAADNRERIYQFAETFTDKRTEEDFFTPALQSEGLGRVIEVWRKETANCFWVHDYLNGKYYPDFRATEPQLKAENARRMREQSAMGVEEEDMLLLEWEWGSDVFWKYYYLTPYGEVLDEGINPFWHGKPSFVFELHDFFVGKIYPFVRDIIDANKQINKLSAISELLSRFSAKSLMLVPEESISEESGHGIDYIERSATDYNSTLVYKSKG